MSLSKQATKSNYVRSSFVCVCVREDAEKTPDNEGSGNPERESTRIESVNKSTMFNSGPIAVDTVGETCRQGEKSPRLFMQEGHQEASSPLSLSFFFFFFLSSSFLLWMKRPNATTWHNVSLFLPKHVVWQSRAETERQRERGNERMGNVYLPRLNGVGIFVHESYAAWVKRGLWWMHTHSLCH